MQEPKGILAELQKLIALKSIDIDKIEDVKKDFKYEPIRYLLLNLQMGAKPEDATSKLLHSLFNDILKKKEQIFTEVKLISGGFADYRILENKVNPTQVELKPLFKRINKKLTIHQLKFQPHKEQVQKYLTENEYLILTNLDTAFLFNRDAIIDYEPFYEIKLIDLLTQFLTIDNLWDTVRRLDDKQIKPDLENQFFTDLKHWYNEFNKVTFELTNGYSKEELIVLFMNKIIFIKTLEDFGLIPYKFFEDQYFKKVRDWDTKGVKKIFDNFFGEIEDWFYTFYDTELFSVKVWDYLKKDVMTLDDETEPHLERFQSIFEKVMGFGEWEYSFGKGMIHYNYRKIDEDIFGKAYETFIAESRKDSGIFYTPKSITLYMVEKTIKQLFETPVNNIIEAIKDEDIAKAKQLLLEMRNIKVIDPSSGSGSFLIKALREIYSYYLKLDEPTSWVKDFKQQDVFSSIPKIVTETIKFRKLAFFQDKTDRRILLANIILNHIYALDIDERAIETAKTNIWKEAIKLEPPVFNFHKLPKNANHILPNLQTNFITADALYDVSIDKQIEVIETEFKDEIIELQRIRAAYISNHNQPQLLEPVKELKDKIRLRLIDEIAEFKLTAEGISKLATEGMTTDILKKLGKIENYEFENKYVYLSKINDLLKEQNNPIFNKLFIKYAERVNVLSKPTFIVAEFFFNYFDKEGNPKPESERGFDAVISNPPWEASKPVKKEYARMDKYDMDILEFNKWFSKKIKADEEFKSGWTDYQNHYAAYNEFMRRKYLKQGVGDTNFYKLFVERDLQIIKLKGYANLLIPSGIQTDKGCTELRKLIIKENTLTAISSFENKGYYEKEDDTNKTKLFPDVHPQFKYSITEIIKEKSEINYSFDSRFYLHHPEQLYKQQPIRCNAKMIEKFSKDNFSIMEFRSQKDYELCLKIRGEHQLLSDTEFRLRTEFHMTNDSKLFYNKKTTKGKNYLPLYEGKMIYQYHPVYNDNKYVLKQNDAHEVLLNKEIHRIRKLTDLSIGEIKSTFKSNAMLMDYNTNKLCYREISSSTNERTFIASIIPKNVFTNHKLIFAVNTSYSIVNNQLTQTLTNNLDLCFYMGLFNSLILNYYLRNKVSTSLSMYFIYELPVPEVSEKTKQTLAEKSFQLLYANSKKGQFEELGEAIGAKPRTIDAIEERADIEIIIAKELFGLTLEEWKYLTSTFVYGKSESKKELDQIIELSIEKY